MRKPLANSSSGFTIIEVMIVIAIVGVLAAIAIPSYNSYLKRAKTVEALNTLTSRKHAVAAYYVANGAMPAYLEQLGWASDKDQGKFTTEVDIDGPEADHWDRLGIKSNPTPTKAKNSWKSRHVVIYIRASKKTLDTNAASRHIMLEGKASETEGGTQFRCTVNNEELLELVPSTCRTLRSGTNLVQW